MYNMSDKLTGMLNEMQYFAKITDWKLLEQKLGLGKMDIIAKYISMPIDKPANFYKLIYEIKDITPYFKFLETYCLPLTLFIEFARHQYPTYTFYIVKLEEVSRRVVNNQKTTEWSGHMSKVNHKDFQDGAISGRSSTNWKYTK